MILDSTKRFITLLYSNPQEKIVIDHIADNILKYIPDSAEKCGATHPNFVVGLPYTVFVITIQEGFESFQTDATGLVIDPNINAIYMHMITLEFLFKISSYCLLKESKDVIELWDVCIFSQYRKQGLGNFLIKNIIEMFSTKNLWLAVVPDNISAASLYIKNGFTVKGITQNDPDHLITIDPAIFMIFNKDEKMQPDFEKYNKQLFKILSDKIIGFVIKDTLHIKIGKEIITIMDSLTKNPIGSEISGYLLTKHLDRFNVELRKKNGISYITLEMHKKIFKGKSISRSLKYNFVFKTLPVSEYNYCGLLMQPPSQEEIKFIIKNRIDNIEKSIKTQVFFRFCFDGLLTLSISPELTEFMFNSLVVTQNLDSNSLQDYFKSFLSIIYDDLCNKYYQDVKQLIDSAHTVEQKNTVRKIIGRTLSLYINQLSVNDLINLGQVSDHIPIFNFFITKIQDFLKIS
jgi:GNAT superfamily N-acetyltransferase